MSQPDQVTVFEVGPRDGLQNEKKNLSYQARLEFISSLAKAGVRQMEVGAFVHPDRVPKMAETAQICSDIAAGAVKMHNAEAWYLVPNFQGLERAKKSKVKNIVIFTAASETFVKRNINKSIQESLDEYREIAQEAKVSGMQIRGNISTAFGCPFEGRIEAKKVLGIVEQLLKMDVYQVAISDTIGVATPADMDKVFKPALKSFGSDRVAGHFHDTRGTALANCLRGLDLGVRTFDSSAGGLGGCPFAPGATGNLATEDLLFMLDGMGIQTGIKLKAIAEASVVLSRHLGKSSASRYVIAYQNQCVEPAYQMDW